MKMRCKNCGENIEFADFLAEGYQAWKHIETRSVFCKTRQGQTIGTYAAPEGEE